MRGSTGQFWVSIVILLALLVVLALLFETAHADTIPKRADRYEHALKRYAILHWGLDAPVSLFAGQVHQESAWRPDARSPYANGLAQFTPATEGDMRRWYRHYLGAGSPFEPSWALQALVLYDRRLYELADERFEPECDAWAATLAGYNGGWGWIIRDKNLCIYARDNRGEACQPGRWWDHVEKHTRRAAWAKKENREYPRKIIFRWQPLYLKNGWGGHPICISGM